MVGAARIRLDAGVRVGARIRLDAGVRVGGEKEMLGLEFWSAGRW